LSRRGFDRKAIHQLREAFQLFFATSAPREERLSMLAERFPGIAPIQTLIDFIRDSGERPLALPRDPANARFGDGEERDDDDA
jgi:UDP-N-acetylglucosamine acyltransferase